jgi:hypothetical protein
LEMKRVEVVVERWEALSGKKVFEEKWTTTLEANRTTELKKLELERAWDDEKNPVVVSARLREEKTGKVLSRVSFWPEPYIPSFSELLCSVDR